MASIEQGYGTSLSDDQNSITTFSQAWLHNLLIGCCRPLWTGACRVFLVKGQNFGNHTVPDSRVVGTLAQFLGESVGQWDGGSKKHLCDKRK